MMRSDRTASWAGFLLLAAALLSCSSSSASGGLRQACYGNGSCNAGLVCLSQICVQPDTGADGSAGNGGSGSGGSGGLGGGGHGGSAGSAAPVTLVLPVGPMTVPSSAESTQCVTVALGNTGHAMIRKIHATFGAGLVDAIVYKSTATTPSALAPCTDLSGATGASAALYPIFETNQATLEIDFPSLPNLTGPDVVDRQMVTIEIHGSDRGDTTGTPLSLSGEIDIDVLPFPAGGVASDLMLTGTTTLSIPAQDSLYQTNVLFQPVDSAIDIFALSTMQHHLGVELKIWQGTSAAASSQTAIVDDTDAVSPGMHSFSTPLTFTTAGSGLAFQCSWVNNTFGTVSFGTASTDETCFIWQYYAPASGYHLCLNGTCQL